MNDITSTTTSGDIADLATDADGDTRTRFTPDYVPSEDVRIWRSILRPNSGGVATVTFAGTLPNDADLWIEQGTSGRLSLYGAIRATDDTATAIRVALVPTGKRTPRLGDDGSDGEARRLGSVKGLHAYLLSVDGTVDRAAHDAARAQRKADRAAQRAALAAATYGDDDGDDGDDGMTIILGL
jgi:hypothetical protein